MLASITTEQSVNTPGWFGDQVVHERYQRGKDTAVRIRHGASLLREALRFLTHCGATLLTDITTARVTPEQKWRETNPRGSDPGHCIKGSSSVTDRPTKECAGLCQAVHTLRHSPLILAAQALLARALQSFTSKRRATGTLQCHVACATETINPHDSRCLSQLVDTTQLSHGT